MGFFFLCVGLLILGYFTYGVLVERIFGIEPDRKTPALELADNVDFIPMPTWKVFMVQLLDIAGVGPIFGPILGALYGPQALLWIVLGSIFAGGVHDFFSGMLSVRENGESIPEVIGNSLGMPARHVMRFFSLLLLILVGVVFVMAPAGLLENLTGVSKHLLVIIIFAYYFLATILPIDKIIGRFYPIFGALLIFMAFSVVIALFLSDHTVLPDLDFFKNVNPNKSYDGRQLPIWPLLFVTLSCGALSGFHSTQSPLMSRCLKNEKHGRLVFYGAMIAEGIIALIWATAGLSFYPSVEAYNEVIHNGTASAVVDGVCRGLLGSTGGLLAILGVVILPITSGDTAFRAARLILAETFSLSQVKAVKRLMIAVPLFVVGYLISMVNFSTVWRYFGWSNQTLAMLVLWSAGVWLARRGKFYWIAVLPAAFMTAVSVSFILYMKIGLSLSYELSNYIGIAFAIVAVVLFLIKSFKWKKQVLQAGNAC